METSFDEVVCLELNDEDYRERKRYFWLKDEIASSCSTGFEMTRRR